jgi:hypothetical protein
MRWGSGIVHGSPEATMEPGKYWDIATSTTHRLGKLEKVRDLRSMWETTIYKILYHHVTLLKETLLKEFRGCSEMIPDGVLQMIL